MKKLILALALMTTLSAWAGEQIQVGVKGMVCAFCAQGIEKKFKAEPSVEKVKVSLENKYVQLTFKDGQSLSNEKISTILKDSGYEAILPDKAESKK